MTQLFQFIGLSSEIRKWIQAFFASIASKLQQWQFNTVVYMGLFY